MTTTTIVRQIWESNGLLPLRVERSAGHALDDARWRLVLEKADLLAVGSLADWARRNECGSEVRVYVPNAPRNEAPPTLVVVGAAETERGTRLLRKLAVMRLLGPHGQRIVFDWGALGWDLAQVALRFGASDLAGRPSPRTLPLANHRLDRGGSNGNDVAVEAADDDAADDDVADDDVAHDDVPDDNRVHVDRGRVIAVVERAGLRPVFIEHGATGQTNHGTTASPCTVPEECP